MEHKTIPNIWEMVLLELVIHSLQYIVMCMWYYVHHLKNSAITVLFVHWSLGFAQTSPSWLSLEVWPHVEIQGYEKVVKYDSSLLNCGGLDNRFHVSGLAMRILEPKLYIYVTCSWWVIVELAWYDRTLFYKYKYCDKWYTVCKVYEKYWLTVGVMRERIPCDICDCFATPMATYGNIP